jgi:hypothetical protein
MITAAKRYNTTREGKKTRRRSALIYPRGKKSAYLGIVFGIPGMEGYRLQVQSTVEVDGGDDVL